MIRKETIKSIAYALKSAFKITSCPDDIEPIFREAAEGGDEGGGAKWHAMGVMGIPAGKFHAMTGQSEHTNDIRQRRKAGKAYRNQQVLQRADYYDTFEKINNLKM